MLGRRIVLDKYSAYYKSNLTGKIHVVDWKRQDLIVREFKRAFVYVPASRSGSNFPENVTWVYDCFQMRDMHKDTSQVIAYEYGVKWCFFRNCEMGGSGVSLNDEKPVKIYRGGTQNEVIFLSQSHWVEFCKQNSGLGIICDKDETYTIVDGIKYVLIYDYSMLKV